MTTSKIEQATRFAQTSAAFVRNAVQRRINKENYILSDKTDNEVIFQDGIMSVKYYRPLTEDILVLRRWSNLTCSSSSFCYSFSHGAAFRRVCVDF
jgi:hypothetical protein